MLRNQVSREIRGKDWQWYSIQARESDDGKRQVELTIYDEISYWGESAKDLTAQIRSWETDEITVGINSPGGDVFDGYAIANALRSHPAKVRTRVDGVAASIASYIFAAGDERLMHKDSMLMWHNAWGMVIGSAKDMRSTASALDKIDGQILARYRDSSSLGAAEIEQLVDAETWLTSAEAAEIGHAEIIESPEVQARMHDLTGYSYKNTPQALLVTEERLAQAREEVERFDRDQRMLAELTRRRMQHALRQRHHSAA